MGPIWRQQAVIRTQTSAHVRTGEKILRISNDQPCPSRQCKCDPTNQRPKRKSKLTNPTDRPSSMRHVHVDCNILMEMDTVMEHTPSSNLSTGLGFVFDVLTSMLSWDLVKERNGKSVGKYTLKRKQQER